jgi:hypothetical protein
MSRQEQVARMRDKLSEYSKLTANPYVSIMIKIGELPFDAPKNQVEQLVENSRLLSQNPANLEAWKRFKALSKPQ